MLLSHKQQDQLSDRLTAITLKRHVNFSYRREHKLRSFNELKRII